MPTQALTLDPRCCDAYVARGAALANAQRLPEAVEDLQRARGSCSSSCAYLFTH